MRCHTKDGIHIPGCMGCAAAGHSYCTCEPLKRGDTVGLLLKRVVALEQRLDIAMNAILKLQSEWRDTGRSHQ